MMIGKPLATWFWSQPDEAWVIEYTSAYGASGDGCSDSDLMIFDPAFTAQKRQREERRRA